MILNVLSLNDLWFLNFTTMWETSVTHYFDEFIPKKSAGGIQK